MINAIDANLKILAFQDTPELPPLDRLLTKRFPNITLDYL